MYCLAKADIINEIVRTTRVDKSSALSVVEQLMTVMKDNFSSFIIKTRAEKNSPRHQQENHAHHPYS